MHIAEVFSPLLAIYAFSELLFEIGLDDHR